MSARYPFFKGMMPILPSVLREDGTPDLEAQGRLVEYVLSCGAVAIGHMAGASEYYKISEYDRDPMLRALARQVNGRVPIFVGTTDIARRTAIRQAEEAADQGADLIMVCSPVVGSMSEADLLRYYEDVGRATSLPVILQDTGASAARYTADFILRAADRVPNIGYVKAEGVNALPKTKRLAAEFGGDVQIIGGSAGFEMPTLLRLGITAFMTGTECTDVHNDCIQAYFAGDEPRADELYQRTILPYLRFFTMASRFSLKHMLCRRGVLTNTVLPFPVEEQTPDPFIVAELDRTLDRINEYRGKKVL
ncbi:MAG: dihydrodipicolinate synthase family protein [Oscillospiraceae bacterium]|nr:dihydrodipicolinate synthase family protein [Oscillospiraceae bacterium]